ncbi:MAG: DUF502 domain-containing protein [Methylotenera sp.]|nr:DUF502 domain-containing protein [Oligoflexia bacterium]
MPNKPTRFPDIGALLRKNFFAGVLVLIPLAVSAWILGSVLGAIWKLQGLFPATWQPAYYFDPQVALLLNFAIMLGTIVLLALIISFLGWSSKHLLGQKILELIGVGISRIPVVRNIYKALDQLLKTMAASGSQQFSRVVYLEYPRKGVWTLAFVTGETKVASLVHHLNVYVPTTPNPTSGFYLIVPEAEVRESHLSVEDAFKTILSLGIAQNTPGATTSISETPHGA